MAGMMWRRSVVLLVFCAWQACTAQKLVNVMEPQLTEYAPQEMEDLWELFDHDKSTYAEVLEVKLQFQRASTISPTKYRITMAEHVKPADYPREWQVVASGNAFGGHNYFRELVTDAVFENGVYEAKMPWLADISETKCDFIRINFLSYNLPGLNPRRRQAIAEVELLGPRESLDASWPYGKYPCSQHLAMITTKKGPKTIFSRSKYDTPKKDLRRVFNANDNDVKDFYYHGARPVIIGAVLPKLPMVHEVSVILPETKNYLRETLKSVVLEGHLCHPRSNTGKCKGWKKLAKVKPSYDYRFSLRLLVENPGKYKAYRLKFIPMKRSTGDSRNAKIARVKGIYFLGCTA